MSARLVPALGAPILLLATLLCLAPRAEAQLADGARYLASADFERAVRAYDRALTEGSLTRAELVAVYEGRAIARWAIGDEADARQDLTALASLEPSHAFSPEAPPPLTRTFTALRLEPLSLSIAWTDEPGRSRVRITVRHDEAGLAQVVRLHARRHGEPWAIEDARELEVTHGPSEQVELWAEALGPGGAVVARLGTELAPLAHPDALGPSARAVPASSDRASFDAPLWIGVGVGAGVLVIVAIIIGVVVGNSESQGVAPTAPVVIGF